MYSKITSYTFALVCRFKNAYPIVHGIPKLEQDAHQQNRHSYIHTMEYNRQQ